MTDGSHLTFSQRLLTVRSIHSPTARPIVCALSADCADELAKIDSEFDHPSWTTDVFRDQAAQPATRMFGCRVAGGLAGFVVAHVIVDEAHLLNLGLRRNFRGSGIGRAFIEVVLRALHASGVFWVSLEVRRSNLIAVKLYKSLGFEELAVRHAYYRDNGEDALVMRLDLRHFIHLFGAAA